MSEETATAPEADAETPEAPTAETPPESVETPQTETDAAGEVAEVEEEPEKKGLSPQEKKIAELAYQNREQKRDLAAIRVLLEKQAETQARSNEAAQPKIEDFETIDDYVKAQVKYTLESQAKPETAETPASDSSDARDELYANGLDKYDDFDEKVSSPDLRITPNMADAIYELDADTQADVAYYLANNPKEARKISKLSEVRQHGEIARIEMKLLTKATQETQPSKAPAPIKPVGGAKTAETEIKPTEDYEAFLKKREKQLGR